MAKDLQVVDEHVSKHIEAVGETTRGIGVRRVRRFLAVLAPFLFWQVAAVIADHRLLPGPSEVISTLVSDVVAGRIWFHAQLTLMRGGIGLGIAIIVGISFGALLARNRVAEATFQPLLAAFYPVPKLALYPLLIVILGFGAAPKIAMVALECAYPITYNTYSGIQSINRQYFWVARNAGASRRSMFRLMMRGATPAIMASLRMAVPIALVIIVVTELIGESRGLGFLIRQASSNFQPARSLAVVLLLGVIGFILDRIVVALTKRVAFWARGVEI